MLNLKILSIIPRNNALDNSDFLQQFVRSSFLWFTRIVKKLYPGNYNAQLL